MKKRKRLLALFLTLVMTFTTVFGLQSIAAPAGQTDYSEDNVLKLTMDNTGYLTPTAESRNMLEDLENKKFSWDNAAVYFVLTDRFLNSDKSNDHSYGRGLKADGATSVEGLDTYTNPGTFHGGDLNGLTQKVTEGYFTDLGVNAIWITAPYEQIHGYTSGNKRSNNANQYPDPEAGGFPYYSYHGYWTLDYTNIDENMGNEQDFEKFVDSCHERGIRVVMDVVMNHVGYTTMQDAVDYGFDAALKGDWQSYYYGNATHLMGGDPESMNYWDKSSSAWAKWWGPGFVRADYPGYTAAGGDDFHMSLSGLPDVVTESGASEVPTPPLLVNKWTKEGRLSQEQKELDDFFSKTGYKKQPRYYIIKWLTDWVREYGVDGFRCDTAKHVDLDAWKDLKTEADKALKEWRANNPTKPGAKWTDDFWMTGEAWGHGMGKSPYFESGGFDSMINFAFNKSGNPAGMEETYSSYAAAINSDPNFNVLSYLSSHDDSDSTMSVWQATDDANKKLGTCLLLAPGGIQIYYGNEVNRGMGWEDWFNQDYKDQRFRTDMDWNNVNTAVLTHWQKVGQFRNNHLSVGAGQHEKLSDSPYTFARTYNLEEDDEDKVVVAVPGTAGTYEVNVGDVFEDGETITDAYSGEKYTVSGGSVSATCDSNGVILLEGSGIVKASVSAKTLSNATTYKTDTFNITLRANKAKDTYYSINGGEKKPYTTNDIITIGASTAYEEKTTIEVTGISEDDNSSLSKTYTYQRSEEPVPSAGLCVKVSKAEFSSAPNIYVYDNETDQNAVSAKWPGDTMTDDGDSYVWTYEGDATSLIFILSQGTWRSTPDMAPGIKFTGGVEYSKATGETTEVPTGEPGKVNIKYVDQSGNVLKSIYRVGVIGKEYTTYPADEGAWENFSQYTLTEKPSNATGVFEKESEVTYVYSSGGVIITTITAAFTNPNKTYTYNGTEHKPEVTVKDGPNPLREGTDYTVSYENNVNAGDKSSNNAPSVNISGMGSYANAVVINKTLTFTIDKAEIPANAPANAMTVSTGKLSDVAVLNGGWSWSDEDKVKDVNAGETISVTAVYNGNDKD
ncbi:MAG: MucBP domain-containing protein, partial [Lachnospiraceae bacterium]|nr:MucBP domain-containing protein [Lachnospiraceae bacterium]